MRLKSPLLASVFAAALVTITTVSVLLAFAAFGHPAGSHASAGYLLLTALAILAVIEHWVLILPVRDPSLWGWAMKPARNPTPTKQKSDWRA